jgi:hypothetical protein
VLAVQVGITQTLLLTVVSLDQILYLALLPRMVAVVVWVTGVMVVVQVVLEVAVATLEVVSLVLLTKVTQVEVQTKAMLVVEVEAQEV